MPRIVAAATTKTYGTSWAQDAWIGDLFVENIEQALEAAAQTLATEPPNSEVDA